MTPNIIVYRFGLVQSIRSSTFNLDAGGLPTGITRECYGLVNLIEDFGGIKGRQ